MPALHTAPTRSASLESIEQHELSAALWDMLNSNPLHNGDNDPTVIDWDMSLSVSPH